MTFGTAVVLRRSRGAPRQAGLGPGRGNQPPYPKENCVEKTGPDWDYAASPNLATMPDGRTVIIASPKQAVVRALDPDKKGETIWEQDVARGIGGGAGEIVFGGAVDNQYVYYGLQLGNALIALRSVRRGRAVVHAVKDAGRDGAASRHCRGRERHSGSAVLRRNGWNPARRFYREWPADLGIRHCKRISNREWSRRQGWVDRRRRSNHRERNGFCWIGICRLSERCARECAAGVRSLVQRKVRAERLLRCS